MMKVGLGAGMPAAAALALGLAGQAHAQTPFTDWESVLKPGATVAVGGVAQEFTSTAGPSGVTSVAPPSTNMAATFSQTFNAAGEITSMAIQNANRTVGFHRAYGDSISFIANDRLIYGLSSDWTRKAIAADPLEMEWKYQSFGAWVSGLGQPQGSMGAASVGAITAGTSVPQTGSASFTGLMGGIYNDASGQDRLIAADMGLVVNFGAHTADFWTTNTKDKDGRAYSELDITGTFLSLPNHPALFGTLNTARLTGTSSAQFYGPKAEEVGGVFTMTPKSEQGLERLAGAFGGKRGAPPASPFTDWKTAYKPGSAVVMRGISQESSFSSQQGRVTSVSSPSTVDDLTFTANINSNYEIFSFTFANTHRSLSFGGDDTVYRTYFDAGGIYARAQDGTRLAITGDPQYPQSWSYQSFGAWQAGIGSGGGAMGAASFGAATSPSAVPQTGTYDFAGAFGGAYIDPDGRNMMLFATAAMRVHFGDRKADFWTLFMRSNGANRDDLFISGSLFSRPGTSMMEGTLETGRLSGPAILQFYGPGAQETGGIMTLTPKSGQGVERITGAFGAKRVNSVMLPPGR